jgi:iron complex outermembrane receptor protein
VVAALRQTRYPAICAFAALLSTLPTLSWAKAANLELADLSLEELTRLEVTTASRKPETASHVAAALFVLTQDDIRRSGATTIPDALRLVPGVQVAQIDGNKWAVTSRGFNSRVANRLLVLTDGRTLYTPAFGGVYWDTQDTMIEDIERIEVVRGPGGAVWGSNAFHGVINIITKHTSQTGGGMVSADAGVERPGAVSVRLGDDGETIDWRVFAKGFERDANRSDVGIEGHDTWRQARIGGRADIPLSETGQLRFTVEGYTGQSGTDYYDHFDPRSSTSLVPITKPVMEETEGAFASGNWYAQTASGGHVDLSASVEYSNRVSDVVRERAVSTEMNFHHSLAPLGRHSLTWGLDLRHTSDTSAPTQTMSFNPRSKSLDVHSFFLQDEIRFLDDRLAITAGAKLESNEYGGSSVLPNLRARYLLSDRSTVWAAASRGVRAPSRTEHDARFADFAPALPANSPLNPLPLPLTFEIWGNDAIASERVTTFEAGWRQEWGELFSADLSSFYNRYRHLRSFDVLDPVCLPSLQSMDADPSCVLASTGITIPVQYSSLDGAHAYGAELALGLRARANWRLTGTYSRLQQSLPTRWVPFGPGMLDLNQYFYGFDPKHQIGMRSAVTFSHRWEWDVFVRYVDELPAAAIDSYYELNTRFAWRPLQAIELALTGNNLLRSEHREFRSDFADLPAVDVERSVYLQLRWSFL